ncbi:MAG: hypothetical protein SPL69_12540, partial [Succinivibrionaceae bacterium]|nr:hypothetical protein [Succinivibrionaceae bacterium]
MQRIATGSAGAAHDSAMDIGRKDAFRRAVSGRLPAGVERIFSWNDSSRGNSVTGWYTDLPGKSEHLGTDACGLGALKSLEGGPYAEAAERFRKRTEAFLDWAGKEENLKGLGGSARDAVQGVLSYVRDDSFYLAAVDTEIVMYGGRAEPKPRPQPKPEPKPEPRPEPKPEPKPEPQPEPKPVPVPPVKPAGGSGCLWKLLAALLLLLLLLALGWLAYYFRFDLMNWYRGLTGESEPAKTEPLNKAEPEKADEPDIPMCIYQGKSIPCSEMKKLMNADDAKDTEEEAEPEPAEPEAAAPEAAPDEGDLLGTLFDPDAVPAEPEPPKVTGKTETPKPEAPKAEPVKQTVATPVQNDPVCKVVKGELRFPSVVIGADVSASMDWNFSLSDSEVDRELRIMDRLQSGGLLGLFTGGGGSYHGPLFEHPTRMDVEKKALKEQVQKIDSRIPLGFVSIGGCGGYSRSYGYGSQARLFQNLNSAFSLRKLPNYSGTDLYTALFA